MRKRSALDGLRPLCYPLSSPMKSLFVSDLAAEQTITSFFLVQEKEIRNTREGKSYLRLSLGDRTGAVEARVWDLFESAPRRFLATISSKSRPASKSTAIAPSSPSCKSAAPNQKKSKSPIFSPTPNTTSKNSGPSSSNTPPPSPIPGLIASSPKSSPTPKSPAATSAPPPPKSCTTPSSAASSNTSSASAASRSNSPPTTPNSISTSSSPLPSSTMSANSTNSASSAPSATPPKASFSATSSWSSTPSLAPWTPSKIFPLRSARSFSTSSSAITASTNLAPPSFP